VKSFLSIVSFFLLAAFVHSAVILSGDELPWQTLEKARIAFDDGEYGNALRLAEQAKQNKKKEHALYIQILTDALKPSQVQRVGDNLSAVLGVFESRRADDAAEIVKHFTGLHSDEYYTHSISALMKYIQTRAVYPEADFLIGNIYFYENEYSLAREYFTRSWELSFALDIPDQKYDILYRIADLADMMGDDELYEQSLLLILADDPYFNSRAAVTADMEIASVFYNSIKIAMEKQYTADKIFLMYRADSFRSVKAYNLLTKFYSVRGMKDEALKTAVLGSLTSFTRMYEFVVARNIGYEYKGVEQFFAEALRYNDIVKWSLEQSVWECFYYLLESAYDRSLIPFSREIIAVLEISPDPAVRERTAYKIKTGYFRNIGF
jgi:HEPN domain-containing protein